MTVVQFILTIIVAGALFLGPALIIRALARKEKPFYWTFNGANTFSIVVTNDDESGDGMTGSGNIVNLLHAIPGKRIDRRSPDNMKWKFVDSNEEDPDHGFLYRTLGVQSMGNIFYTTRVNLDRRVRYAREEKVNVKDAEIRTSTKEELHNVTKVNKSRSIFYTGELTVEIKEADTADKLGLNFEIDLIFARRFPIRSVLRLADSAAFLTSLVETIVNNTTVAKPADEYIGGKDAQKNRRKLINDIEGDPDFRKKILDEIGLEITAVSLRDVSMLPDQRRLLQLKISAEKAAEAKVIEEKGDRDAQLARNEGDADRVTRVIIPAAQDGYTVAVRGYEAYERNNVVTTYAPGTEKMLPLNK